MRLLCALLPTLLLASAVTACAAAPPRAAPLVGTPGRLEGSALCRAYTCKALKVYRESSVLMNVFVTPGGSVTQYALSAPGALFDVWLSRNKAQVITDVRVRLRSSWRAEVVAPVEALIRLAAGTSETMARNAAAQWYASANRPQDRSLRQAQLARQIVMRPSGSGRNVLVLLGE